MFVQINVNATLKTNKPLFRHCIFFILLLCINSNLPAQSRRFSFTTQKMASPFTIILYAEDSAIARQRATESFSLVDSLVNIFSDYIDSSELNRLSARAGTKQPMNVSDAMLELMQQAKYAFVISEGSFDITIGPLTRLWRKARKENRLPDDSSIKHALSMIGSENIMIDTSHKTISLTKKGMQLDAGGIAQGYIAQQVINYLQSKKIDNALVDVSGDIVAIGSPPGAKGWKIGINQPEQKENLQNKYLLVSNAAVTTSGDVYHHIDKNGKRYSHIIDPRTGYGITNQENVTVIARDGTTADWFTKVCSILPYHTSKRIAASLHAGVMIATITKEKTKNKYNKTFRRFISTK